MPAGSAEGTQGGQSLSTIREEQAVKEIIEAIREWCRAGKPHKR